jgi:hypothetical protein
MEDIISRPAREALGDTRRRCTATSKTTGERCGRAPIVGGFVCPIHGGKIPAVQKSARERLLAMVDPALDALLRFLRQSPPCEVCGRSDADRDPVVLRAAQMVLDRTGFHPSLTVEQTSTPNRLAGLSLAAIADHAEAIARRARAAADAEAAQLQDAQRTIKALDAVIVDEPDAHLK